MDFLGFVRGLSKRDTPPTSAELRQALAEAETAAAVAHARAAELAVERANILLDATDAALDRAERDLQLAQRDADRADIAAATLRERIAQAEASELQADLDAAYETATAAQARGIAALKRYAKEAPKLAAILAEIDAAEIEIARHRATLEAANDPRRKELVGADRAARPLPEGRPYCPTVVQLVELPALEHGVLLWPAVTVADQLTASAPSVHESARAHAAPFVPEPLRLKTIDPFNARYPGPVYLRGH